MLLDAIKWIRSATPSPASPRVLLVDGFDQLSRSWQWLIRMQATRRGCGLVVTSHATLRLPVLAATSTSPELALQIASRLAGSGFAKTHEADIRSSFARHNGNLREVLFDLYDRYERIRRQ
jgi:hypothetical protein